MPIKVHRLEQALRAYEDWCLEQLLRVKSEVLAGESETKPSGALLNWQGLRTYVLNSEDGEDLVDMFVRPPERVSRYLPIPELVYCWNRSSRRVYKISDELQMLLASTSLTGLRWNDVEFPFESFLVELDTPIVGNEGRKFDVLGFSRTYNISEGDLPIYQFVALPQELETAQPFPKLYRQNLVQALARNDWKKVLKLMRSAPDKNDTWLRDFPLIGIALHHGYSENSLILDRINHPMRCEEEGVNEDIVDPSLFPEAGLSIRIIVGLCIYLKSLKPNSAHTSPWKPIANSQKLDPRAITNGSQICTVSSRFRVPKEHLEAYREKRSGYELSAHWREGHYRRRPGDGNNPAAPRVVWVRPTLVRRDRLQEGQLPGGSMAELE